MKRGVPAVLLASVLLLSSACGDDDDDADPTTTAGETTTTTTSPTTTEATTTTAAPDPAEEVKAAYLAYWEMYVAVNDPPNPADPRITELTTGPALPALLTIVNDNLSNGWVIRAPAEGRRPRDVTVASVQGGTAEVSDCSVDNLVVLEVATGRVINDEVVTNRIEGTMLLEDGKWKVFRYDFVERWQGISGCAA